MGKIFDGSLQDLESYLDEKGFKFYKTVEIDNIYISKDFKKTHKCRITAVPKPLAYYMSYHFAVTKNSPYTELIDQGYHIINVLEKEILS